MTITHLPIDPIPELETWSRRLREIASQSLEYCEEFPTIARRFEAWWAHDALDRPIFIGTAKTNPARAIKRRIELVDKPDEWFAAKYADMLQTYRVGEAFPVIRVDLVPVILGGLFGAPVQFDPETTWTHAIIRDDWSNEPEWRIREADLMWRTLLELTERVARDAAGRYLVCTPDFGGSADVLLNLRGGWRLCLDVIDRPERVLNAVNAIYPAWCQAFVELYRVAMKHRAGLVHWLGLWSNRPYLVPACDFSYMIGVVQFNTLFLPDIARQTATAGRGVFHLDGIGATRHIDALLEVPHLEAIQFTPGEGTPSALRWVEMFRKIQARGRSLLIMCPPEEVLPWCEELRPEGLAIKVNANSLVLNWMISLHSSAV